MVSVLCCREEQVERLSGEKLAVEERAAEQAVSLRQLSEPNKVLPRALYTLQSMPRLRRTN
jgi:hypothetical protein